MAVSLAFIAACFAVVVPRAVAGDKINFSDPSDHLLDVPRQERNLKPINAPTFREALSHHGEGSDFGGTASGTTIIIPATKSLQHFGWTAPFEKSRDQNQDDRDADRDPDRDADNDGFGPDPLASGKTSTPTNSWSATTDHDSAFSMDGEWQRADRLLSEFGAGSTQKNGQRGDDRFSNDRNDSRFERPKDSWLTGHFDRAGEAGWFHDSESRARKEMDRMRQGEPLAEKDGFSGFYRQPFAGFSRPDTADSADPFHSSAFSTGISTPDWRDGHTQSQIDEAQMVAAPSIPQPWEQLPTAVQPQRPVSHDQPFSAVSRAPVAPAVLAFPHRPGDLFQ
jgi:hypothetical protein